MHVSVLFRGEREHGGKGLVAGSGEMLPGCDLVYRVKQRSSGIRGNSEA